MSVYPRTIIDENGRLMCEKRHTRTATKVYGDEGDYVIEVFCETCFTTLWYNGS